MIGNSMNDSLDMPAIALAINGGDNEPLIQRNLQREPGYCRKVKQDIQTYVLDLRGVQNIWFVLFVLLLDFFLQNILLGLYVFYFLKNPFVND